MIVARFNKKLKYRNKPVEIDGIKFASKKEARRYEELRMMEKQGLIRLLTPHPPYRLEVNNVQICTYIADFCYVVDGQDLPVVEDTKGYRTDVYKLKKRLMKAVLGIEVKEI